MSAINKCAKSKQVEKWEIWIIKKIPRHTAQHRAHRAKKKNTHTKQHADDDLILFLSAEIGEKKKQKYSTI